MPAAPDDILTDADKPRLFEILMKLHYATCRPETRDSAYMAKQVQDIWSRLKASAGKAEWTWKSLAENAKRAYVPKTSDGYLTEAFPLRLLNLALAIARGDIEALSDEEFALAKKTNLTGDAPNRKATPTSTAEASAGPLIAEVAYTWLRGARPNKFAAQARAATQIQIASINPEDAEIVMRLPHGEGDLEIRKYESEFYRPLLAPGCWKPITRAAFLKAAQSGVAWRDRPYQAFDLLLPPRDAKGWVFDALLSIGDVAFEIAPASGKEDEQRSSREDAVKAACGDLAVIGDGVWVRIDEPSMRVVATEVGTVATWTAGTLIAIEPQSTLNREITKADPIFFDRHRCHRQFELPFGLGAIVEAAVRRSITGKTEIPETPPRKLSETQVDALIRHYIAAIYAVSAPTARSAAFADLKDDLRRALIQQDDESATDRIDAGGAMAKASAASVARTRPPLKGGTTPIASLADVIEDLKLVVAASCRANLAPDDEDALDGAFQP